MDNIIQSLLTNESIVELRELKGKFVSEIRITTAGSFDKMDGSNHNMGFLLVFKENESEIAFLSNSIPNDSNVEFPRLEITHLKNCTSEFKQDMEDLSTALGVKWIGQRIVSISMIRDTVKWITVNESWVLIIDKGLMFKFENNLELLVIVRDSSLGMMDFWIGKSINWINDSERF
jgi:hypothetical protein